MQPDHPFAGKTWRQAANELTWTEFREALLDSDCLQLVHLPWWKQEYDKLREWPNDEKTLL